MVRADSIVTLTTRTGQNKGSAQADPPASAPLRIPYSDDFEDRNVSQFPKYFSDNGGSFEIIECAIVPHPCNIMEAGQVLGQMVSKPPMRNAWVQDVQPITVMGENNSAWSHEVELQVRIHIPKPGSPIRIRFIDFNPIWNGLGLVSPQSSLFWW